MEEEKLTVTRSHKIQQGQNVDVNAVVKEEDRDLCKLCMSCPRSVQFGCGHSFACHACARSITTDCLLCREGILAKRQIEEDNLSDSSGYTFSDPDLGRDRCFSCNGRAAWRFTCPDCHSQRISKMIDLQSAEDWRKLRRSRFMLCKECVGKFKCLFCSHLAVKTDVFAISDDDLS